MYFLPSYKCVDYWQFTEGIHSDLFSLTSKHECCLLEFNRQSADMGHKEKKLVYYSHQPVRLM